MDSTNRLGQQLVTLAENDLAVREVLASDGSLSRHGYRPRMEAVHIHNATCLAEVIDQHGWPGESLVGERGAWAAWLIAQHAIGNPRFMRQCLSLLKMAASEGEVPAWQPAFLEDRIRMYEGRPQLYGTQFQPGKDGRFVSYPIEDPEHVNDRRRAIGLDTIEERLAEIERQSAHEMVSLPPDWEREYDNWLIAVGWRKK
ncbi:DUF6624 domain-containing protein [Methylomonas sp. MgM2]